MKAQDFNTALQIITSHNNTTVTFNAPRNGSYNNPVQITIKNCNAGLTKKLIEAGFSLDVSPEGMTVEKYL